MQKLLALLGLALVAGGCAAALPLTTSILTTPGAGGLEIHNQTEVHIDRGNFVVVRTNVVGESKGFALLGLITIVPARFNTAMNRFYSKAQVEAGKPQSAINLVMEKTSTYWILFSIPRVTVRADIVEFNPTVTLPQGPGFTRTGPD